MLALDLGSTRIKAARIDDEGRVLQLAHQDAPPITSDGLWREFDPELLVLRAAAALGHVMPYKDESLAIASQRSSFVLFDLSDARGSRPLTSVISWQDRRGADWISSHADAENWIGELTGLPLSAHYVGPKLAALFAEDPVLAGRAHAGKVRLGTLETWLAWGFGWKHRKVHPHWTDETMAARTLLFDPRLGEWSPRLCEFFGVPLAMLPRVLPSCGRHDDAGEMVLAASIADQSAGALHAVGGGSDGVLVNFGTGTFVLAPVGTEWTRRPGYLTALLLSRGTDSGARERIYALEGTINAGSSLITTAAETSQIVLEELPDAAHALVDSNGIGAPHWRPDLGPIWSPAAAALSPPAQKRIAELGLCFRVREILEDLKTNDRRCVVAGGALHDEAFAQRLADALGRTIEVCTEPEATLLGAAGLARGDDFARGRALTRTVEPGRFREHLDRRFEAWRLWVASALAR
ncbi:MAG TPA: FGGY family carbohydrate kinase [Planctomycetota bacterium]|nr:FGGY family carbohydrate kinase [Planctomycetota bacterium]